MSLPKETFNNLPQDKRDRIMEAALEEFANRPYHQASLSRIVAKAEIAKGSMYQYFEDKFDLYLHLIGLATTVKLDALRRGVERLGPDADIFDMLMMASTAGMEAIRDHPRLNMIGNRLIGEGPEFLARVLERFGPLSEDMVGQWLQMSIDRGHIDQRVNPRVANFLVNAVIGSVGQETAAGRLSQEQAVWLLEQVWDIVKLGMKPRDGSDKGATKGNDRG